MYVICYDDGTCGEGCTKRATFAERSAYLAVLEVMEGLGYDILINEEISMRGEAASAG